MSIQVPKCACGCGQVVARTGKRGRVPQYASASCRKRAERFRRAGGTDHLEPWPGTVHVDQVPTPEAAEVNAQVERALLEARGIGFALLRLGTQARPELAWRCTKLGQAIVDAVGDTFGKETAK